MEETEAKVGTRTEITSEYANNTFFEPTIWDLKILFGEFTGRTDSVDWHTSITLPWARAKLLAYYLGMNIAFHEASQGTIEIPRQAIPKEIDPVPEPSKDDQLTNTLHNIAVQRREEFLKSLLK